MRAIEKDIDMEVYKNISLIFCTCFVASALYQRQVKADVVILDEAAQIGEPGAIVSLSEQRKIRLVVLAGDEKQLGPVVKSNRAGISPYGDILQISLMTRLIAGYPHLLRMALFLNYRAHPKLIRMPSKVFYGNLMQPGPIAHWDAALKHIMDGLFNSGAFGAHGQRMVASNERQFFINVQSTALREPNGHSWSNEGGDVAVVDTVDTMAEAGVPHEAMGIITMYKRDGEAIRSLLAERGLWGVETADQEDIETATVDAFQGREKPIILVHFVSAHPSGRAGLGHIANARRLCVATTRAQEYQIFFGNLTHWQQYGHLQSAGKMKELVDFCKKEDQILDWEEVKLEPAEPRSRTGGNRETVRVQDMDEMNNV